MVFCKTGLPLRLISFVISRINKAIEVKEEIVTYPMISNKMNREFLTNVQADLYTPLEEAIEELWRRWSNVSLRKRVEDYLGIVPVNLRNKPKAILGRFIATPNYEMWRFIELSKKIDMDPVVMELSLDRFCTRNPDKLSLVHMPFYMGKDKNGKVLFEYQNVSDCTKHQGKHFADITTYRGETLVNLHHRLLSSYIRNLDGPIVVEDASYLLANGRPGLFYSYFLPRFICHGILFENFTADKEEQLFVENVVIPTFTQAVKYFGLKPLVVPLLPDPSDIFWRCYQYEFKKAVLEDIHNECELGIA